MLKVLWALPETFPNFIPRLGGMHMLMSYVGCVGNLMTNSGLEEVLGSNKCSMMMEASSGERALVDIGKTVAENQDIAPYLLAAHALSGCDTVAKPYGIGKKTAIKVLQKGYRLDKIGDTKANFEDVIKEAT